MNEEEFGRAASPRQPHEAVTIMKKRDWSHAVQLLLNQRSFGHSEFLRGVDLGQKLLGGDFP